MMATAGLIGGRILGTCSPLNGGWVGGKGGPDRIGDMKRRRFFSSLSCPPFLPETSRQTCSFILRRGVPCLIRQAQLTSKRDPPRFLANVRSWASR